jgi:hypothetical protein
MGVIELLTVLGFGLSCFSIGYTLGKDTKNTRK